MSYTWDAEKLLAKLKLAGLDGIADQLRDGKLAPGDYLDLQFIDNTQMNSARFLLYAFLRQAELKPLFKVQIIGPSKLRISYIKRSLVSVMQGSEVDHTIKAVHGTEAATQVYKEPSYGEDGFFDSEELPELPELPDE